MLISEMEAVLKSLDQRVGRIEQILPSLATKSDLERYATKAELRDEIRGVKVLVESARDDLKVVHERMDIELAGLNRRMDDRFAEMLTHFAEMKVQLGEVLKRISRS